MDEIKSSHKNIHEREVLQIDEIDKIIERATDLNDLPPFGDTWIGDPNSDLGVLLIHGLGGSNIELIYLGNFLASHGYRVFIPILPGHGTNYRDLAKYDHNNWRTKAISSYFALLKEKEGRKIFVGGHSLGGTLSIELGLKDLNIHGIFSLAAPIQFPIFQILMVKILSKTNFKIRNDEFLFFEKQNAENPFVKFLKIKYRYLKFKTLNDVFSLLKQVKSKINKLTIPLLIVHSKYDQRVPLHQGEMIYNLVSSNHKEFFKVDQSYHILVFDNDKESICDRILVFLNSLK